MTCPECRRDFPAELLHPLVTATGKRTMCPLCGLRKRNELAGLPLDAPFQGAKAKAFYNAAVRHLAKRN